MGALRPVSAVAVKDLRLLTRDGSAMFFTFIFPMMVALFFGFIFGSRGGGGGGKMDVALVNEDGGPASVAFAKDIADDDALSITSEGGDAKSPHPLSLDEGKNLVRKGRASACIVIPKGFEESSSNMFSGGGLKVEALVDPAHTAEAGLITGKLNELGFKQMSRSFTNSATMTKSMKSARERVEKSEGLNPDQKQALFKLFDSLDKFAGAKLPDRQPDKANAKESPGFGGWRPVQVTVSELTRERTGMPTNSFEISFPQGVVWGLMGCMMAFGVSLVTERTAGTMLRLTAAPITRQQILLGKALACFITCVIVQTILVLMGIVIGKIHVPRYDMLALAIVACAVGFSGLMMVIAGLSKSEGGASGMGRGVVIMLAMIGGGSVPLFMLPPTVQKIAGISPFKWATQAIEGAVWRGFTFQEMLLPVSILLVMGVVGYLIGSVAMKRTTVA
jgi:ABC-2 type transport system permease protein